MRQWQGGGEWLSGAMGAQRRHPVVLEEMAWERISRKSVTGARLKGSLVLSGQRKGILF